jgi:adenylate cyclase
MFRLFKRHALRLVISLSILVFFVLHASKIVEWDFIKSLEYMAYDTRLEISMPRKRDDRIVLIEIDEKSLSEVGRWPWNRSVMASLVDKLFDTYHIDLLGIDVVFPEPDDSSGLKKLQMLAKGPLKNSPDFLHTLKKIEKTLDYDSLFTQSLKNRRVVLGYSFGGNSKVGKLPKPFISEAELPVHSYKATGFAANLPIFQDNALTAGHFTIIPDADGIVRRIPMLYNYNGQFYQSFSLAIAWAALGSPDIELGLVTNGEASYQLEFLQLANRQIPVDEYIQTLIPFRGRSGHYPYISASDVLYGRIKDKTLLKNKIVLLGTSAQGLSDSRATPIQENFPGIEIHANLISGILDDNIMSVPDSIIGLEIILLIIIGGLMIIVLPLLAPLTATFATFAIFGSIFVFNLIIWNQLQLVLPLATIFLLIWTLFLFNMSYGYILESSNKRHLKKLFGQYVPPELVNEMNKNLGKKFSMECESKTLTVLFSDIRGFTTLSEGLKPKQLSQLMNDYLTPMTSIIHQHRGTIDKYMGDAIMAFWGAPLEEPQHAGLALDAAMAMLKHLESMQSEMKAKGWPTIKIGVGLNTGQMSVGNMGSKFRMAYTVLGDAVNLGSRLEGLTKQYGVAIIVSETTKCAVPEYIYRQLDSVKVKGKEEAVNIYEPIGKAKEIDESVKTEINAYEQARKYYRQQQWTMAKQAFAKLCTQNPNCFLYKLYAERVEKFLENPPTDNWDGVYTHTTK